MYNDRRKASWKAGQSSGMDNGRVSQRGTNLTATVPPTEIVGNPRQKTRFEHPKQEPNPGSLVNVVHKGCCHRADAEAQCDGRQKPSWTNPLTRDLYTISEALATGAAKRY